MPRKLHCRQHTEDCPIIFSNLLSVDPAETENVQRAFKKKRLGRTSNPNYGKRWELPCLALPQLRRVELNLTFLLRHLKSQRNLVIKPIPFDNESPYAFRNKKSSFKMPPSKVFSSSKLFTIAYFTLWNRLPDSIQPCQILTQFKNALFNFHNASSFFSLNCTNICLDEAFGGHLGLIYTSSQ